VEQVIKITKALSDSNRVRALYALRKGELCVCRIIALLGLAPSTVSKHMTVLKHAGLVDSRKEERWIYYRLPGSVSNAGIIKNSLGWLFASLAQDDQVVDDSKKLSQILRQSPETLCKKRLAKFRSTRESGRT
jgi:ArsR family transcriptional regulator, arsenate/arsenite/antimonite-responsive transcriptional repressor